ncbi:MULTISPECIES: DUF4166 domain-containing protein [unclassified Microbacterium]|uniref:DUF4166 domain-containing protein n=1 Tax=unclassified Microbacterium TaxID=2609290 RepID=UPI003870CB9B
MTSMFAGVMGSDFARLHPQLQRRFGVGLSAGEACVGTGVMTDIRRGPWWTVPFLQIGRLRNILIPSVGEDVPFVISNYPYRDPLGRETVTFVREYRLAGREHRFDATMIEHGGRIVDYLGTHQHLAVDLDLRAEPDGSLLLTSGEQRFYEGPLGFRFPLGMSGRATLRERYDDAKGRFEVDMRIDNDRWGFLFGYRGWFTCEWMPVVDAPARYKPVRHQRRT